MGLFRETEAHSGMEMELGVGFLVVWLERGFLALVNTSISFHHHPLSSGLILTPSILPILWPASCPSSCFGMGLGAASRQNFLKIELEGRVRAGRAGWRRRLPLGVWNSRPRCFLIIFRSGLLFLFSALMMPEPRLDVGRVWWGPAVF